MKLQHLRLGFCDEIHKSTLCSPSSSVSTPTINIKCLCPVTPKLAFVDENSSKIISFLDNRSFGSPKADKCSLVQLQDVSPQGGTRWNPTPEQIKMLEELYKGGMRTPNMQQIERISTELENYGRIEGKNVFYWFQNHKARERQRQKRSAALLALDATPDPIISLFTYHKVEKEEANWSDRGITKRKCRRWHDVELDSDEGDGTLELFPLHPGSRKIKD